MSDVDSRTPRYVLELGSQSPKLFSADGTRQQSEGHFRWQKKLADGRPVEREVEARVTELLEGFERCAIVAFLTGPFRGSPWSVAQSSESELMLKRLARQNGWNLERVRTLRPWEEANLLGESAGPDDDPGDSILFDIGGFSTEYRTSWGMGSIDVGHERLLDCFSGIALGSTGVSDADIRKTREYLESRMQPLRRSGVSRYCDVSVVKRCRVLSRVLGFGLRRASVSRCRGVGGTAKRLHQAFAEDASLGRAISLANVNKLVRALAAGRHPNARWVGKKPKQLRSFLAGTLIAESFLAAMMPNPGIMEYSDTLQAQRIPRFLRQFAK